MANPSAILFQATAGGNRLVSGSVTADGNSRQSAYAYGPYGEDFAGEDEVESGQVDPAPLTINGMNPNLENMPIYPGGTVQSPSSSMSIPGDEWEFEEEEALEEPPVIYSAPAAPTWQPYRFSGKESLTRVGLPLYDFGARMYSPSNTRWMTIDPLAEKYYHISPYVYCAGNPVNLVDPEGTSTWVTQNEDGTYKVVGGEIEDNDLSIYVVDDNYKPLYTLGYSLSYTSFYNMDDNNKGWMIGATIDLNDMSGIDFIHKLTSLLLPPLPYYMVNALNGKKYDFKVTNGSNNCYSDTKDYYRGMPFETRSDGQLTIASARDIGNYVAGYQAGARAIPWIEARAAFDALQVIKSGKLKQEGAGSQVAQFLGWLEGWQSVNGTVARALRHYRL